MLHKQGCAVVWYGWSEEPKCYKKCYLDILHFSLFQVWSVTRHIHHHTRFMLVHLLLIWLGTTQWLWLHGEPIPTHPSVHPSNHHCNCHVTYGIRSWWRACGHLPKVDDWLHGCAWDEVGFGYCAHIAMLPTPCRGVEYPCRLSLELWDGMSPPSRCKPSDTSEEGHMIIWWADGKYKTTLDLQPLFCFAVILQWWPTWRFSCGGLS